MYIFGGVEDNLGMLVWSLISDGLFRITSHAGLNTYLPYVELFYRFIHPLTGNQSISALVFSIILTIFHYNGIYLILLGTTLLNFFVSLGFFNKYKYSYLYAAVFAFSAYFWIQFGTHFDLMQIWLVPWILKDILNTYEDDFNWKSIFTISIKILVAVFISNYIGFSILMFTAVFAFINLLEKHKSIKMYIPIIVLSSVFIIILLFPYFKANYGGKNVNADLVEARSINRTLEDFITFSSRPWYYLIPPIKNPVFGSLSQSIYSKLQSTNYFLADDYFPTEHSASYLGISVWLLFIFVITRREIYKNANRKLLISLIALIVLVIACTMPPFFTISGIKIFTPGYLVFKLFPIFRVTARLSLITLLPMLYIIARFGRFDSKKRIIILHIILLFTLIETFVPVKIVKYGDPPQVYTYLHDNTREKTVFSVYPYSYTKIAFLWLHAHQRYLLNSRGYMKNEFMSETFTNALNTPIGINALKTYKSQYLIVSKESSASDLVFFRDSPVLKLIKEFPDTILYEVK